MKRCPECRRDFYDDTLLYCLDDGNALLEGPASGGSRSEPPAPLLPEEGWPKAGVEGAAGGQFGDEPQTAILHSTAAPGEALTRAQTNTTDQTAILRTGAEEQSRSKLGDSSERHSPSANRAAKPLIALAISVVVLVGGFFAYRYFITADTDQINSIAVLPFQNVGGGADTEYLSDGISEALINSLTELRQLKVIARSTAFRYKGIEVDPLAVGRELNVRAVLMGRVRQVGDSLNVQVDLVDAATGAQLWGKEYERKASDLLSVKQAIAREVTENLRLRLSGEQQQQLKRRDTADAGAYQAYLRGRYYWNRRTADGLKKAIEAFQNAIDRDPGYALAYTGLADSYILLEQYAGTPANEALPKAGAAANRALEIDGELAEAHTSLAFYYHASWRWEEAEKEFKRAISLNPKYATARHWYQIHLRTMGRLDEALEQITLALELDPLSPILQVNLAAVYRSKGDFESAMTAGQKVVELDPNFSLAHETIGIVYIKQQKYAEAIEAFQKDVDHTRSSYALSTLGYGYAVAGRLDEALSILRELEEKYNRREALGQYPALVYAGLGDKDKAFEWIEKDFQARSGALDFVIATSRFDSIHSDPRFADLRRRMGLPN